MYHFPNLDIYHPHQYQQQYPIITDHSKNPNVLAPYEAVIPHNVVSTQPDRVRTPSELQTLAPIPVTEKQKKVVTNKGSVDTSNFSIEERLVAAVWVHERKHTKNSMRQIKHDFRQRFGRDPPAKNTLLVWERKLFSTGSVHDAPRPGRPVNRQSRMDEVAASVHSAPTLSLRARALALRVPRTTLRTIMRTDMNTNMRTDPAHAACTTNDSGLHTSAGNKIKRNVKRQIRRKFESQVERGVVCATTGTSAHFALPHNGR